jgi:hypothetical protein
MTQNPRSTVTHVSGLICYLCPGPRGDDYKEKTVKKYRSYTTGPRGDIFSRSIDYRRDMWFENIRAKSVKHALLAGQSGPQASAGTRCT